MHDSFRRITEFVLIVEGSHNFPPIPHQFACSTADLEEAAILAANHSKARAAATVPVDWTRRKWVRKPRGAAPGAVIPDRVRTVFVSPDPALADRLQG